MKLDSVRDLKQTIQSTVVAPMIARVAFASLARGASQMPPRGPGQPDRLFALGVSQQPSRKEYRLAVRIQRHSLRDGPELERLSKMARGEIDIRFVGRIDKRSAINSQQQRHRPLQIGTSIGHRDITAGTLGCFVTRRTGDRHPVYVLSNNHVLANEDRAKIGDPILQPGRMDGGNASRDKVATLSEFVKLKKRHNRHDCAIAAVDSGRIAFDPTSISGRGKLAGLAPSGVEEGARVAKLGRTTGLTRGRVTAFELDDVVVAFDTGNISFDNVIEVEGSGNAPFSDGGDSGSLVINGRRQAVGILFAGSETGGRNQAGLTYVNPIRDILDALKVELLW